MFIELTRDGVGVGVVARARTCGSGDGVDDVAVSEFVVDDVVKDFVSVVDCGDGVDSGDSVDGGDSIMMV